MSWTTCAHGHAHWGPRGAAGLLLADRGTVLLQLRARWAHQGGTWSIPGGARERGESAVDAALREAREEMAIRGGEVEVRASYVVSAPNGRWRGVWRAESACIARRRSAGRLGVFQTTPTQRGACYACAKRTPSPVRGANCGGWEYETVLAVPATAEVHLAHRSESVAHVWAGADEVGGLPLHPAFRSAWEAADWELRSFVAATG